MTSDPKQPPVFEAMEISYLMLVLPDFLIRHKESLTKDGKRLNEKVWKKLLDYRDFFS